MSPALKNGDEVTFESYRKQNIKIGDILVVNHPYSLDKKIVKRVSKVKGDSLYFLEGDNSYESSDSRTFGYISTESIIAIKSNEKSV
tara:strand:+ start:1329 stop:1589 length:261 start_codon:yes stop_codon:yes gene_type:complete